MTCLIEREQHQNESNSKVLEKPKIENDINRTLLVGPSFSGKTYLMLNILSRISDRDIFIVTESPPEQSSNAKIKPKEKEEEITPLCEYKNVIIVFHGILGSSNSRYMDQFFKRGRLNNLDYYCLSQSYFDLPKRTIRNDSNKIFLLKPTINDLENLYRDVGGYDLSFEEFEQ